MFLVTTHEIVDNRAATLCQGVSVTREKDTGYVLLVSQAVSNLVSKPRLTASCLRPHLVVAAEYLGQ